MPQLHTGYRDRFLLNRELGQRDRSLLNSHWGIGSEDCSTATGSCGPILTQREIASSGERAHYSRIIGYATQELMSRKATRQLNMMAAHKNALALGQGEEERRVARGNLLSRWATL